MFWTLYWLAIGFYIGHEWPKIRRALDSYVDMRARRVAYAIVNGASAREE